MVLHATTPSASAATLPIALQVLSPREGHVYEISPQSVEFHARISGPPSLRALVNGEPVAVMDGGISLSLPVSPGTNSIRIVAEDDTGERIVETLRFRVWDRTHGLRAAAERHGFEPVGGLWNGRRYDSERLDFEDTTTGAPISRLTSLPGNDRPNYPNDPVWNPDGSMLLFRSERHGKMSWIMEGDGSGIRPVSELPAHWDRHDPRLLYTTDSRWERRHKIWYVGRVHIGDEALQREVFWDFPRETSRGRSVSILGLHPDGRKLLVAEGNQDHSGIRTRGYILDTRGGDTLRVDFPGTTHNAWFTRDDGYSLLFNLEDHLVDDRVAQIWCGAGISAADCRLVAAGAFLVSRPFEHERTDSADRTPVVDDLAFCRISSKKLSHPAFSPNGRAMTYSHARNLFDAENRWTWYTGLAIARMGCDGDIGTQEPLLWGLPLSSITNPGHRSWQVDDGWLVDHTGRELRRIDSDGWYATTLARPNTHEQRGTYDSFAFPETSPDGTKVAFGSSMLGDVDLYQATISLPEAPQHPWISTQAGRRELRWAPPIHAREIAGYEVWGSERSGGEYALLTDTPVSETRFPLAEGENRFLVVTAVEHSGLGGLPSSEVYDGPVAAHPVRIRIEAERGELKRPFALHFDGALAGLYAVTVRDEAGGRDRRGEGIPGPSPVPPASEAALELTFDVPIAGDYRLWAYTRGPAAGSLDLGTPGRESGSIASNSNGWRWQPAAQGGRPLRLRLPAGTQRLTLRSREAGVFVDQILLTSDLDERPSEPAVTLPMNHTAPPLPAPQDVRARPYSPFACLLEWRPPSAGQALRTHVYRDSGEDATSRPVARRIASVPGGRFLDWGVAPGSRDRYELRAVDRRGIEGTAERIRCETPALTEHVLHRIDPVSDGAHFDFRFSIPADDRYVLWLLIRPLVVNVADAQATLCLTRGDLGCQPPRALFTGRWTVPLGPLSLPDCCPSPVAAGEWLWTAPPLRAGEAPHIARLRPGPHLLRLELAQPEAFEVCMGLLTNDQSFIPTDDPSLPAGALSYLHTTSSRGECRRPSTHQVRPPEAAATQDVPRASHEYAPRSTAE